MILLSDKIRAALEREPAVSTVVIDLFEYADLIAGQSEIVIEGQPYGVVRYDRLSESQAKVVVVVL